MRKIVKIFNNGIVWEVQGNMQINIPTIASEEIDVSEKTDSEIETIKKTERSKIDKVWLEQDARCHAHECKESLQNTKF